MFRALQLVFLVAMVSSCSTAIYPGGILVPQVEEEGDWHITGGGTVRDAYLGFQGQVAHTLKNNVAAVATVSVATDWDNYEIKENNDQYHLDLGLIYLLGKSNNQVGTTYQIQGGISLVRTLMHDRMPIPLHFQQNQLYLQASSRHMLFGHLNLVAAMRFSAATVSWIGTAPSPNQIPANTAVNMATFNSTYRELTHQTFHFTASPVLQLEVDFEPLRLIANVQPNYVLNQPHILPPSITLNAGIIWRLRP
ncbi:MAG: hypothetical protein C0424_11490 [Sphingobacteriaceae bacterium]|nr:hypothetical protein [Sphingobacteriaceae bacterium]